MKNNYLIYCNDFLDLKIVCYLIRFYIENNKRYSYIIKSIYNKYYNIFKNNTHNNIKIIINNNSYILFEYDNIDYDIIKKYHIDSDEFNNQIINNTKKLVIYLNNDFLIYNNNE